MNSRLNPGTGQVSGISATRRSFAWSTTGGLALICRSFPGDADPYLLFMIEIPSDVAVFAVACDPTGTWFALAPTVRELSGTEPGWRSAPETSIWAATTRLPGHRVELAR